MGTWFLDASALEGDLWLACVQPGFIDWGSALVFGI